MKITKDILYVGVNDHDVDLFEGQYIVPNGMAYNSYVIVDEKIAVMDTVDAHFTHEWLDNIENALGSRKPDYLIIQHMEPDHSANIASFMNNYKDAVIVSSAKAFTMMKQFFGTDFEGRNMVIAEGDTLSLGKHTFHFVSAPMVHWPEVMLSYETTEKVLFSADAFGKFGALDVNEDWTSEARRYYINIVGKYGAPVQTVLKKASALDIKTICPLHGPVLNENLEYYLGKYDIWSSYAAEDSGVMIAYASIYGNTAEAAERLADILRGKGVKVETADLTRDDMPQAVANAFRYDKLAVACSTYDGWLFPVMEHFLNRIKSKNYQNRKVALIENGSWAPVANKVMRSIFETMKNITFTEKSVTVNSAVNEQTISELTALADELSK